MLLSKLAISTVTFGTLVILAEPLLADDAALKGPFSDGCLRLQKAAVENARLPTSTLRKYCDCVAEELVAVINSEDRTNLSAGQLTPSLERKEKMAGDHCAMTLFNH
jgi:hypothetical protein